MSTLAALPATIPSPTQGVWYLGPIPVRAYALCILMGILIAVQLGERRWGQRGGRPGAVLDIAAWAVPFGIVGGRLYHVVSSWQPYFGAHGDPVRALYIWEGGLGIWGAVSLGALGAWIGARRAGILLPPLADALAPGIVLAQAVGRWGNWFNNELYGGSTNLPWGLRIYQWDQGAGHAVRGADDQPIVLGIFHPTFLYESLWDVGVALAVIWADRRWRLGHGRVFALYVLLYTVGRGWIEALRVDPANTILGLRLNLWTSLLVGLGALIFFVWSARTRPGREQRVSRGPATPTATEDFVADAPDESHPADESQAAAESAVATEASDDDGGSAEATESAVATGSAEATESAVATESKTADDRSVAEDFPAEPETGEPETGEPETGEPETEESPAGWKPTGR